MSRTSHDPDRDFRDYRAAGDPAALARVFDALAGRLLLAAGHLCDDPATAEDIVQTTFVAAIEAAQDYDPRQPVLPWFLGILAHRARDQRRQRRRRLALLREHHGRRPRPGSSDPAVVLQQAETVAAIAAAVAEIPAQYRDVLNLRHAHGLQPTEIAHALNRPLATVKSQLQRGVQRLKRILPPVLAPAVATLLTPERGLAAMRDSVLAAAASPAVAPTTGLVLSTVMKKKLVAGLACILFLSVLSITAGWWELDTLARTGAMPGERTVEVAPLSTAAGDPAKASATLPVASERTPLPAATGSLRLRLLWADGAPAVGIGCRVFPSQWATGKHRGRHLQTTADGTTMDGELAPGTYTVFVSASCRSRVEITAGRSTTETVMLPQLGTLVGEVVSDQGQPLTGARIVHRDGTHDTRSTLAVTDRQGRFSARIVAPALFLQAEGDGWGHSKLEIVRSQPGELHRLTFFMLPTPGALRGVVVGADARPLAGADVYLDMPQPSTIGRQYQEVSAARAHHARTDAAGRFEFTGMQPGKIELEVRANGFAHRRLDTTQPEADDHDLTIRMQPEAAVAGSVRDASGQPIAGAQIATDGSEFESRYAPQTVTDARGRFRLAALVPGRVSITVHHAHHGTTRVELDAAIEPPPHDIVLTPGPALHGRVLDGSVPAAGWTVRATAHRDGNRRGRPRSWRRTTQTDAEGRFELTGCDWPAYTLAASQPAERGAPIPRAKVARAVPGDGPVTIRATPDSRPSARIRGRVQRPEGFADCRLRVFLHNKARRVYRTIPVAADGGVESARLPPGEYKLGLQPDSELTGLTQRVVVVGPGETRDLGTLTLERPTTVRPRLRAEGGGPLPPIYMVIRDQDDKVGFHGIWFGRWIEPSGTIPVGRAVLEIRPSAANMMLRVPLEVSTGGDHRPVIQLPAVQRVRWTLRPAPGIELPAACRFALSRTGGGILDKFVFIQGRRSTEHGLLPGHYRLELSGQKRLAGHLEFTVGATNRPGSLELTIPIRATPNVP